VSVPTDEYKPHFHSLVFLINSPANLLHVSSFVGLLHTPSHFVVLLVTSQKLAPTQYTTGLQASIVTTTHQLPGIVNMLCCLPSAHVAFRCSGSCTGTRTACTLMHITRLGQENSCWSHIFITPNPVPIHPRYMPGHHSMQVLTASPFVADLYQIVI